MDQSQVQSVPKNTEDFSRVEHLLHVSVSFLALTQKLIATLNKPPQHLSHTLPQLSVRTTAVKDVTIWSISNPSLTMAHERHPSSSLSLEGWVDINTLEGDNSVQDVCRRGFFAPSTRSGLMFTVGSLPLAPSTKPQQHQFLLCSVGVGRSHVLDAHSEVTTGSSSQAPPRVLPAGYDSLYYHTGDDAAREGESGAPYSHRYIVLNGSQALPKYVIHFTLEPSPTLGGAPPRRPASEINLADIKSRISEALSVLGPAASAATEKMLSDIGSAYDTALAASRRPDPLLEERKRSVHEALELVDSRLKAIQENSAAVEEALYAQMQAAMFSLQDETQRKLNVLLSEELELRRQLGQLAWMEGFTRASGDTLPPMSFISTWERQQALQASLYPILGGRVSTRPLEGVVPDLKLVGHLAVTSGSSSAPNAPVSAGAPPANSLPLVAGGGEVGVAPPPPVNSSEFWGALLRSSMGLSPPPEGVHMGAGGIPVFTLQQATAELARAQADLGALEVSSNAASMASPNSSSQLDAARGLALSRVAEAQHLVSVHSQQTVGKGAAVVSNVKDSPGLGRRPDSEDASSLPPLPSLPPLHPSLEQRLARFSLRKEAERRRRTRDFNGATEASAFLGSPLLLSLGTGGSHLFACLPTGPTSTTRLLAAQEGQSLSVSALLTAYTSKGRGEPSVLLVRSRSGHVFGGYAEDPWATTDLYYGTPRSFLFSLSRDVKLPYHGRVHGPRQANDEELRAAHELANLQVLAEEAALLQQAREMSGGADPVFDEAGRLLLALVDPSTGRTSVTPIPIPKPKPFIRHDALRANSGTMAWGVGDLILRGDLSFCTSELEHSYGIGLRAEEAGSLLAGSSEFSVDRVELWALGSQA